MNRIQLKYNETAIIPDDIVLGEKRGKKYELLTGEIVTLEYRFSCDNRKGMFDKDLEELCQENYGIPFSRVKSMWFARLGKLSGFWHSVRMHKVG